LQVPSATANALKSVDTTRNPAGKFYGLGESRDGRIWGGQGVVTVFDHTNWSILPQNDKFRLGVIEAMFTSREHDLWVGSRQYGIFRFDGQNWQRFHVKDGLIANTIRSITQTADGNIWVATDRGISCFDGQNWTSDVLPVALNMAREAGSLKASPSGALWINRSSRNWTRRAWPKSAPVDTTACEFWAVCFQPTRTPPNTSFTLAPDKVEQPGNVTLTWKGSSPWHSTKDSRLQFSFRLDNSPWSPYDSELTHSFFALPSGSHHFEVRARDADFNVDPHPASLDFVVLPPVWKQAWFIGLMLLLTSAVATQTLRVFLHAGHLRKTNAALASEIDERKRMQLQVEAAHKDLIEASRQAGMAEVATSILHNVGNVLNSVNVSADLVADHVRHSRFDSLPKLSKMLAEHANEPNFLVTEKGRQVPSYLASLSEHLAQGQAETLKELASLRQNISHIKDIISMQQEYSKVAGFTESVKLTELVQDALRLNEGALLRHHIQLNCDFQDNLTVIVEKHKVLQILVNLIRNAKYACDDSKEPEHCLTLRTRANGNDRVQIQVCDNGVGIPSENLTKIFGQGFTTRKNGHGFGLHSAANAAKQLGGSLLAESEGPGKGATFTLEFPTNPPA
jgi:signal transduction histidine kinase